MQSELSKIQNIICQNCDGNGTKNSRQCPECNGKGLEAIIENKIYYWGMSMSRIFIYQRALKKNIDKFINFILIIFTGLGLFSLGIYIYLLKDFNQIIKNLFLPNYSENYAILILFFWMGLLPFMYLVHRLERLSNQGTKVKKKISYLDDEIPKKNIDDYNDLRKKEKIDISSAFTQNAIKVIEDIYKFINKNGNKNINPFILLTSLLQQDRISIIFLRLGVDYARLKDQTIKGMTEMRWSKQGEYFLKKILLDAYIEAYLSKQDKVDVEELLISLIKNDALCLDNSKKSVIIDMLYELEIDSQKLINVVEWLRIRELMYKNQRKYRKKAFLKPKGVMNKAMTSVATPILDRYSQDLTFLAKYGYLFPCIGRKLEIQSIFRAIESGRNGVILSGDIGVGRSAIISGIAQSMVAEDVPKAWQDKRLVSLSIARLVSGANPQNAMERLSRAIDEVMHSKNIILVIENIEGMIGISSGSSGSSLDLSEVLTSIMSKSNLIVIATTTSQDYTKYIEKSILEEVFYKINIEEPEDNELIQILESKTIEIESKNKVFFSYGALEKALIYAKRFIHNKFLPAKAIDLIEETGVFVKKNKGSKSIILAEDVAKLVSQKIKIPLTKITGAEGDKLVNLENRIHKRMIDQVEAVKAVASALKRARVEFRDIKRPIANLMFLGPTGVGKTELAKTVAEVYFGDEKEMIRIDMSEYQNKDSIDRLIGAPDDYGISGLLTEQVRKNPFSLILLDEIEKAHPDILNIFLQVFDDGRLTDNKGRVIDFSNVIIIATSNAGTSFIQEEIKKAVEVNEIRKALISRELKKYFRPEFLNRFDSIVVFKPLSIGDIKEIAKLMLKSSAEQMDKKGIKLEVDDQALDWIANLGYDPVFGARPLRRAIQNNIDTVLAEYLIERKVKRGDKVLIKGAGEFIIFH
ncbi:AAA family ATPase [Patescibacteria group bacterium]